MAEMKRKGGVVGFLGSQSHTSNRQVPARTYPRCLSWAHLLIWGEQTSDLRSVFLNHRNNTGLFTRASSSVRKPVGAAVAHGSSRKGPKSARLSVRNHEAAGGLDSFETIGPIQTSLPGSDRQFVYSHEVDLPIFRRGLPVPHDLVLLPHGRDHGVAASAAPLAASALPPLEAELGAGADRAAGGPRDGKSHERERERERSNFKGQGRIPIGATMKHPGR